MRVEPGRRLVEEEQLGSVDEAECDVEPALLPARERLHLSRRDLVEFERLDELLRPGGWLAVMTTMRDDTRDFAGWWYVRDFTHVCFYRPRTMEWIARAHAWQLELPHPNVALFRKAAA